MPTETLALWLLLLAAALVFGWRFWRLLRPLTNAPSDFRWDRIGDRLGGLVTNVGLHRRLLKFRYSGVLHLMIFSGFVVLFSAIVESFGSGLFPGFSLASIGGQTWIALLQEVFSLIVLTGIGLAAWQRYVRKPARFEGSSGVDATVIYLLVVAVVGAMVLEFSFGIVAGDVAASSWRPVSNAVVIPASYFLAAFNSSWSNEISPTWPSRPMRRIASRAFGGTPTAFARFANRTDRARDPKPASPTMARFSL